MTSLLRPDSFYDLPAELRNKLLALHGKARKPLNQMAGFSGEIVFLDNGEGVSPRLTVAKYPRWRSDLSPADSASRFVREIKHQAAAHYHPNVHWPFELILILGVPAAYFRRWEGDLSDYIEVDDFGDIGRLSVMTQLVAGLAHCHARGLVHQDLKPENVFVRDLRAGFRDLPDTDVWLRPLVADFGSVNLAAEVGEFGGSRPYMAPEQWQRTSLGEWTSVFVVGIILHELMSRGAHPIGEHGGDWHKHVNPNFNRWQQNKRWRKWIEAGCKIEQPVADSDVAALVAACLRPAPDERPSLHYVEQSLRALIRRRSTTAIDQVDLFLGVAVQQGQSTEWAHLTESIERLERAIAEHYEGVDRS